MNLSHYPRRVAGQRRWTFDPSLQYGQLRQTPVMYWPKPLGLWVSVDGKDDWPSWCLAESFIAKPHTNGHRVTLKAGANLRVIQTAEELDQFTAQYREADLISRAMTGRSGLRVSTLLPESAHSIAWDRVAQDYDGIVIAPYIWERRLHPGTAWYYGWDCASGVIWNLDVVESVKLKPWLVRTSEELDLTLARLPEKVSWGLERRVRALRRWCNQLQKNPNAQ